MSHHYIEFKNTYFSYPEGKEVLSDISFRITHGQRVALLGLNGSGKSTLLQLVNGLLTPTHGEVIIGDIPVVKNTLPIIRQTVGMVFQNADDMLFMPTIYEDVAFGPRNMKLPEEEVERRVKKALTDVGLSDRGDYSSFRLSGGQRRSAAIAAVLAMEPAILLLDEPTSNLDSRARRQVIDILNNYHHTILVATHDIEFAKELCDSYIMLEEGKISEYRTFEKNI